jgi:hypothetical protein
MPGPAAGALLAEVARRNPDAPDRRKIAEALGAHAEQAALLTSWLADPDASVRADAVWAAGSLPAGPGARLAPRALVLMSDIDMDVAANATAAVARLARAASGDRDLHARATGALCKALGDYRPYVRANAITGLGLLGERCEKGALERKLLAEDPSEIVRLSAARLLLSAPPNAATPNKDDARALSRCVSDDKSGMVANACRASFHAPSDALPALVFVVPDGKSAPLPLASYSLMRADGLIRSGRADRRGAIFERATPAGELRLIVPGPLAS